MIKRGPYRGLVLPRILFAFMFEFLGLYLLGNGRALIAHARDFGARAQRGQGEVIRLRAGRKGVPQANRVKAVFYPTLRFTTAAGRRVEAESPVGSNPPPARRGEQVPILYDPADPTQVRVDSVTGRGTIGGGVLIAMGVLLLAAALGVVVSSL